jgi:hypothetical protein
MVAFLLLFFVPTPRPFPLQFMDNGMDKGFEGPTRFFGKPARTLLGYTLAGTVVNLLHRFINTLMNFFKASPSCSSCSSW